MIGGWGRELERLASGHTVVNRFLGAVGSLYGVLRLLLLDQEEVRPDLVILEFLLNDMVLHRASPLSMTMLAESLDEIASICARHRLRLLLIGLEPRLERRPRPWSRMARVGRAYRRAADRNGLSPVVEVADALGEPVRIDHYRDENHLTQPVSERLARHVIDLIETTPPEVPRVRPGVGGAFAYVDAGQASPDGAARPVRLNSAVFEGPFLELARPSFSTWPGSGRVAALMLRSDATSGTYRLSAGGWRRRKNAHSIMLTVLSPLMVMPYVEGRLVARDDLVVAMPEDEDELGRLVLDPTFQETAPPTPFAEQVLHINGIMFWRGASALARLARLVDDVRWTLGAGRAARRPGAARPAGGDALIASRGLSRSAPRNPDTGARD